MNSRSSAYPLNGISSGTPCSALILFLTFFEYTYSPPGIHCHAYVMVSIPSVVTPVSRGAVQCSVVVTSLGSVAAQIWVQTRLLHRVTLNKLPDLSEPLFPHQCHGSTGTSFHKSISGALKIQLHEMQDCFLTSGMK